MISIHVPAWGTTICPDYYIDTSIISIHVPAWGTTKYSWTKIKGEQDFNPRSRVGNDEAKAMVEEAQPKISIHVPAWGTTEDIQNAYQGFAFQSTFPRGERRLCKHFMILYF